MLDRLKPALVDSFAGAIAIGLLLAEGIQRVAYIFSEPVTQWLLERFREQQFSRNVAAIPPRLPFEMAIPQLFTAFFLLGASYVLLRWLYFPRREKQDQDRALEPGEDGLDRETGGAGEE
jgi:hypothetical protein